MTTPYTKLQQYFAQAKYEPQRPLARPEDPQPWCGVTRNGKILVLVVNR